MPTREAEPMSPSAEWLNRAMAALQANAEYDVAGFAGHVGCDRGDVAGVIETLALMGVPVISLYGRILLREQMNGLNVSSVRARLPAAVQSRIAAFEGLMVTESTNEYLIRLDTPLFDGYHLCHAESQTRGRGRRGRAWFSPFGSNLYLSLAFDAAPDEGIRSDLSLTVAVSLADALQRFGLSEVGLKWPNDLYWSGRKLGGVLIEQRIDGRGWSRFVIGVGINISMPTRRADWIDQPWADLQTAMGCAVDREALAAEVVGGLCETLDVYRRDGSARLLVKWPDYDVFMNAPVSVTVGAQNVRGTACGVDEQGRLRLLTDNGLQVFDSGEVSLRPIR